MGTFKELFKLAGSCGNLETVNIAPLNLQLTYVPAMSSIKWRNLMEKFNRDIAENFGSCR